MSNPETLLVNKIIKALKERGGYWLKVHGSPFQKRGVPDIVGCYEGYFIAFEVKLPGGSYDATELQLKNIRDILNANGMATVVRSVEEALKIINFKEE